MRTDDFDLKTQALDDAERARLLLCMVRYENSGLETELPGNERFLWPVFRLEIDREKEQAAREEAQRQEKAQSTAERARKAAEARWGAPDAHAREEKEMLPDAAACESMPAHAPACDSMRMHSEAETGIFLASVNEKEKGTQKEKEKGTGDPIPTPPKPPEKPGFSAFWAAYPRKDGKKDALKAWNRLAPGAGELEEILSALGRQRASPQWTKEGGQFIPLPATWLNGRRWEDRGLAGYSLPPGGKTVSAQSYAQRPYSEQELLDIGPDLIAEARTYREGNG